MKKYDKKLIIFVDGFNGILALIIYNFALYLTTVMGIGGIIGRMENTMGNFGINFLIDLGFSKTTLIIEVIFLFAFAFFLGTYIGKTIRKIKKVKF